MPGQVNDAAFDFGRPQEADRARRPRQRSFVDQLAERARHFEYGHAAGSIVVGARARMIQVAGEEDFLLRQCRIRSVDPGGGKAIVAAIMAGIDVALQQYVLTGRHTLLQPPRFRERDHESKGPGFRETAEVTPADQAIVLFPPGRALVRGIRDYAGRTRLPDGALSTECRDCHRTNVLERRGAQLVAVRLW